MLPGNPQILTCPFCGKEKEIMSLMSGNSRGLKLWSDNKQIAPMLPEISYVQKCPHCGKYYIKDRQPERYADEGCSFEQGLLTFPEMKEAFAQLAEEGFQDEKEESAVRMMLHHAYNDYYYRSGDNKDILEEDKTLFRDNALWLINNLIYDDVMKAEFYREIGDFDTARSILDAVVFEEKVTQPPKTYYDENLGEEVTEIPIDDEGDDDFLQQIASAIRQRVESSDCAVFMFEF